MNTADGNLTRDQVVGYYAAIERSFERQQKAVFIDSDYPERIAATQNPAVVSALVKEAAAEVMRRWRAEARELARRYDIPAEITQHLDPH